MWCDDRGTVTAELAIALPAVLVVLTGCLGCIHVVARQSAAVVASAAVARSLARGDDPAHTGALLSQLDEGSSFTEKREGDLVCATVSATAHLTPAGPDLPITARSCALAG